MNNQNIYLKKTTLHLKNSINRSPLRAFLLVPFVLGCFGLSPTARAVTPAPDGAYPNFNTAEGGNALFSLTTGSENTAIGFDALYNNTTGFDNTANGAAALYSNTTGNSNTAIGFDALYSNSTGNDNTADGAAALLSNTIGSDNTANGFEALFSNTSGSVNTASGSSALRSNTTGHYNMADGYDALVLNTSGNNNVASGWVALENNTTGSNNIAIGASAGYYLTTGSNNIDIGNEGKAGESNYIRIGTKGTHTHTLIAGISGVTVAGGVGVIIDTNGKLGTVVSSERFKEAIKPMDQASEAILALHPVTFRYKHDLDPVGIPQFGLVAEQVEKVDRDLVARDDQGKPFSVRYEAVNAMLLNEFLKAYARIKEQERKAQLQDVTIAELEVQLKAISARLDEQAAQVQKVVIQSQLSQRSARVAVNAR